MVLTTKTVINPFPIMTGSKDHQVMVHSIRSIQLNQLIKQLSTHQLMELQVAGALYFQLQPTRPLYLTCNSLWFHNCN